MMINNDSNLNTKSRIFTTSLKLFASQGFENVSIRDLGAAVGIKSSSIYHYYDNKEAILDACYDYYTTHQYETRLTKNQYDPVLRNGTKQEVLNVLNYSFKEDINMYFLNLIVFSRICIDYKAKKIYLDGINNSITYLNEFFNYGIEVARFQDFNVPVYSLMFLSIRHFVATSAAFDPEQEKWHEIEVEIFNELVNIIPFSY